MINTIKFFLRILLRLLYGVEVKGLENYHKAGNRVLIIANHTSLLDGVLLYAWLPETPIFAINTFIAKKPQYKFFLKFVDLFIMDHTSPLSIKSMIKFIKQDKKAVIFPEGRITVTGTLMKVYEGPGMIADKADATLLPVAIDGAQFSTLSYMKGKNRVVWFPKIKMTILPPERMNIETAIQGHQRRKAAATILQDLMFRLIYTSFNYETTIFNAILEAANRYGKNKVVLQDINNASLTYRGLILKSVILGELIRQDTDLNEHVGILLPNITGAVVTFMAMQYAGRIPTLLNFTIGANIILNACKTGQVKTVYTSKTFIEKANLQDLIDTLKAEINLIYLEDLKENVSGLLKLKGFIRSHFIRKQDSHSSRLVTADMPAVILFTSGSEGIPKGVVLSHRNILSNYAQVSCHIDFNARDLMFSCLPLFHSFGLNAGCIMPLLGGSKIFLYPTPLHYRIIPELIYELGATILFGTNTFFKGYARHAHPFDFNSLRYVVAGAEKLHEDTQLLWMEKFGIRILQGYGVTETSPVISVNTPMVNKKGSVGRPMTDLDYYLEPVEGIDKGGKLVVHGPNIMLGYLLHDSGGKIIAPRTGRGPGWHDTGDIADIDEEGFIYIIGRAKRFAKIGGEMISLTRIEEIANQVWPGANHAAINLPDEKKGEKILLITDKPDADRKEFLEHVRNHSLGELFIPRKILVKDSLPVLGTGKIDYIMLTKNVLAEEDV